MSKHLDDLYEILNNLEDDLKLDLDFGDHGYKSYKDSYDAVKEFTLKLINKKISEAVNESARKLRVCYKPSAKYPHGHTKVVNIKCDDAPHAKDNKVGEHEVEQ